MKWVALALILLAAPFLAIWLRGNPPRAPWAWGLLTFLPFVLGAWHLDVAPFATPVWSGFVKGWEISLLDAVAIGVILGTRGRMPKLTMLIPLLIYFLAILLSVFQARFPNYALSYVIQFARVILVFVAVSRVAMSEAGERALIAGLAAGLAVQAGYAIMAKLNGAVQTGGSLGHQNLLGYMSHMVVMPAFAMLLSGRAPKASMLALVAGAIAIVLGASRATLALAGLGLLITLILSLSLRFTSRKLSAGALGLLFVLGSVPFAVGNLNQRMATQGSNLSFLQADEERFKFANAARGMLSDYPMGVGANHYVFVANTEGYSQRAGVAPTYQNLSANVHNAYLLVAAESGYLGILAYALLYCSAIVYCFATVSRYRQSPSADLLIGVGVALMITSIHSFVEWVGVLYACQFVFAGMLGLTTGIRSRLDLQARAKHTAGKKPLSPQQFTAGRQQPASFA